MEQYYYLDENNQQKGPIGKAELISAGVRQQTMIWKKGMPNWQPASSVPEVADIFAETLEPAPPPLPVEKTTYTQPARSYSQTSGPRPDMGVKPDSYLVWSILTTILCCPPFGIAAIVYSAKVDGLWNRGDAQGARDAAKQAKTFNWVAFGLGLAIYVFYLIYIVGIVGLMGLAAFEGL